MASRTFIAQYLFLTALLLLGSVSALAATDLTRGEWEVAAIQTAGGYPVRLEARLVFTSQTAAANGYQLEGYFDWLCTAGAECHGRELFHGLLSPNGQLTLAGEDIVAHPEYGEPLNLRPARYTAHLHRSGEFIERGRWSGADMPEGEWQAIRRPEEDQGSWEWIGDSPRGTDITPRHIGEMRL